MEAVQVVALVLGLLLTGWMWRPRDRQLRGRVLSTGARRGGAEGRVSWGGGVLPGNAETSHFIVVGTTGSGKTLTVRRTMREVLPDIGFEDDQRALIYDAKQDVLAYLSAMGIECPVVTLNPFDARCASWDMASDIRTPSAARQLAKILVPSEKGGGNTFFTLGARDLLAEIVMTLIRTAPDAWTLRDLVLAGRSGEMLETVLSATPSGQRLYDTYFHDERTGMNVLATLRTNMAELEPVASLWQKAEWTVSLEDWVSGNFILVLGSDESVRAALDSLNRLIFRRLVDLVLSSEESSSRRSWFFLDEVREAGKLDGLTSLLTKGRSKGACCVLGFQDVEGLRDAYGVHLANELMGMCSNKAILRLESSETADWASKLFGETERIELRDSMSSDGSFRRSSRTKSEQRVKSDSVMKSEFLSIPATTMETGLTGYYLSPTLGAYRNETSLLAVLGDVGEPTEPNFIERSSDEQWLTDWQEADLQRLGLMELLAADGEATTERQHAGEVSQEEAELPVSR